MFGKLRDYNVEQENVHLLFEGGNACIKVISDRILHIYANYGMKDIPSKAMDMVQIKDAQLCVSRESEYVLIETKDLYVKVYDEFKIDIYRADGVVLCRDYRGNRKVRPTISKESLAFLEQEGHAVDLVKDSYAVEVVKEMDGVCAFYGLGDRTGFLNKKGYDYDLWNTDNPMPHVDSFKTLYKTIPFFIAKKKDAVYGIFMDNPCFSHWDFGKENEAYYYFGVDDGNLNYYFYGASSIKEIVEDYTEMTGRVPLPQMWTLGHQQSRFSYESREEVLEVARRFREDKIPCDAIHFDIDYMDAFKVFTFCKERYGEPSELMQELSETGYKPVVIIDPGVKKEDGYAVYDEGKKKGFFATDTAGEIYENVVWPGTAVYPDFGRKEVRAWWADNEKYLVDMGVRGVWNDMNEPAGFNGDIPQNTVFYDEDTPSTHARMHNVYGHLMSQAAFEGMKKHDGRRPFIITRACYAGSQKYTTAWTGDNHSIWAHLQMAIPQLCNLGLSGMGFVGTDLGGFGSDVTPELMCRWVQVGCFSPLCRNHSAKGVYYQEPWQFDEETKEIYRKFISLRYELLPYLYDCFYQMSQTGAPVFRPLVMEAQDDENTWQNNDQFMVGEHLLVSPVVTQGERRKIVYLPQGDWFDFENREMVEGGKHFLREVPLSACPMYVKAGTILPMYPLQQYVGEQKISQLILQVFEGEGSYVHYQDDGESFDYEKGIYNLYNFSITKDGVFTAERTYVGYEESYSSLKVIYKGQTSVYDFTDSFTVTL